MFTLAGNEHKRNSWKDAIWCNLPYLTCDQFILNLKLSDCKIGLDAIVLTLPDKLNRYIRRIYQITKIEGTIIII